MQIGLNEMKYFTFWSISKSPIQIVEDRVKARDFKFHRCKQIRGDEEHKMQCILSFILILLNGKKVWSLDHVRHDESNDLL